NNEDVQNILNEYWELHEPIGNVTYVKEGDSYVFKYIDENGDSQVIDVEAIVKKYETVTTITPEVKDGKKTGKYVYKNESLDEVTIDVVGDVITNFDEIINNEDVQNILNEYWELHEPIGNVTYVKEGDSYVFKYIDENGDSQVIDVEAIVKKYETVTTITPEIKDGKNTGKYVYKNETLDEVTIDVVGDVINNFDEIINNEDVQNDLYLTVANNGKKLSSDNSITVASENKAVLQDIKIAVAIEGIQTTHLTNAAVTTSKVKNSAINIYKINSGKTFNEEEIASNFEEGEVLTADGKGGVIFKRPEMKNTLVDYSFEEQVTGQKWIGTDKEVIQRVFEVEFSQAENKVTLDGDFIDVVLDARFINQSTNSSTRGLIKKEIVNGKTILTLGTPGTLTVKHPKGKYYLILEYVKK
ncbi:hypothetical protein AAEZ63_06230, partial [Myroides sp. C2723]